LNQQLVEVVLQPIFRTHQDDGVELGPFQVGHLL
jgi:hypothetical protein